MRLGFPPVLLKSPPAMLIGGRFSRRSVSSARPGEYIKVRQSGRAGARQPDHGSEEEKYDSIRRTSLLFFLHSPVKLLTDSVFLFFQSSLQQVEHFPMGLNGRIVRRHVQAILHELEV